MNVSVTGGAGFIGHHLVYGLLAAGHRVSVLDDFSTGDRSRLQGHGDRLSVTEGSVVDPAALDTAFDSCQVVFHEAAIASVARSLVDPRATNEVNVSGTIEVMLAARRSGVGRVVFAGSSAIYGIPAQLPCSEQFRPAPLSPYGVSKLAAEHYVHALGQALGVDTVVLRYFNVFGPGQDPQSEYAAVVPRFILTVLQGRQPVINGTGEITRDFVFIDDVVRANLLAAEATSPSGVTCNIASGERTSLLELASAIGRAAGRAVVPSVGPPRQGDILHSQADISLARSVLGYEPTVPFAAGIARTFDWYRAGTG